MHNRALRACSRPLSEGDIINIDITVFTEAGFHGDTSRTFCVGEVDSTARELVSATVRATPRCPRVEVGVGGASRSPRPACEQEESMYAGIAAAGPGASLSVIGRAIADVADEHRFGLVRSFAGHGIGQVFHASPLVKHYRNNDDTTLVPGALGPKRERERGGEEEEEGEEGAPPIPAAHSHPQPPPATHTRARFRAARARDDDYGGADACGGIRKGADVSTVGARNELSLTRPSSPLASCTCGATSGRR